MMNKYLNLSIYIINSIILFSHVYIMTNVFF